MQYTDASGTSVKRIAIAAAILALVFAPADRRESPNIKNNCSPNGEDSNDNLSPQKDLNEEFPQEPDEEAPQELDESPKREKDDKDDDSNKKSPIEEDFLSCVKDCLDRDPLFHYVVPLTPAGLLNLKTPSEIKRRPHASKFTTLDRRLPRWMKPKVKAGAEVIRGKLGRIKYIGRYGTTAAAISTFAISYSLTALARCSLKCKFFRK